MPTRSSSWSTGRAPRSRLSPSDQAHPPGQPRRRHSRAAHARGRRRPAAGAADDAELRGGRRSAQREARTAFPRLTTSRRTLDRVIELRTPTQIEQMRPAGRFVASVIGALAEKADVGVNLLELDELAHRMIKDAGASSCYIDYHPSFGAMPFGKVLCTSVNDAVLHGLPFDYRLRDGDNVSLDFAAEVDGWVADSAITVFVGTPRDDDVAMAATAERALAAGIAAAVTGNRIGDISAAIGTTIGDAGYAVNTAFGGHGVGHTMHERPDVPNAGERGRGLRLQP